MTLPRRAAARPPARLPAVVRVGLAAVAVITLAACGVDSIRPSPVASGTAGRSALPSASLPPTPSPTPSPTPLPTPQYTNPADAELAGLIPQQAGGATIQIPPVEEFAVTPGDFGEAYGELGLRFTALQLAYVEQPRLSLYVARVAAPAVTTEELEPHLETAGRYVGIAGLVREPWELTVIDGRVAWVRPEDNATVLGTMIYTWAADEYVFLLIGVDDALNRAVFAALPGEAAPSPTPRPSRSPGASADASPGTSQDPEASESPSSS